MRKVVISILLVVALPVVAHAAPDSLKIGAVYSLSGFANIWGEQAQRGIDLAVSEVNARGGVNGRKVEIIYEDSKSTAAGAVAAFYKLVNVNHTKIVLGDIMSFATLPLVPLAQRAGVLLVTPSIFETDLPEDSNNFYTTCPHKSSIQEPVNQFFAQNKDVRTIAIICANNSWGLSYLDIWKQTASSHQVQILDSNCTDNYSTDMRAEILRAKSYHPDGIILAFGVDRALQRMQEISFHPKVLTTSDLAEAILSRGFPPEKAEGVYFNDWLADAAFKLRFEEQYKRPPIMEPQNSYEALRSVVAALEKNSEQPIVGMRQVKYQGVAGLIDFTGSHAGNFGKSTLMMIENGQIVPAAKPAI